MKQTFLIAALLSITLSACGNKENAETPSEITPPPAAVSAPAQPTEAVSSESVTETAAPSEIAPTAEEPGASEATNAGESHE